MNSWIDNVDKAYSLKVTDDAIRDLQEIIRSLENSSRTTAKYVDRFKIEVDTIFDLLLTTPHLGRMKKLGNNVVRCISIPRFNYAIYTDINDDVLEVIAFAFVPERAGIETIDNLLNSRIQKEQRDEV